MLATFLSVVLILGTFGGLSASAHGRYYGWHYHSRARGALIGGAVTGYLIQGYRNDWRRHYYWHHWRRHYYRRH